MSLYIFVSIICIGSVCDFMTSEKIVTKEQCDIYKQQFHKLPFKPEVTLAATQCMQFKEGVKV